MIKYNISDCPDKLYDESRLLGTGKIVFIPESQDELVDIVQKFIRNNEAFTIQGGRTSITGSSVSETNNIISIEKINKKIKFNPITNSVVCDCGIRLIELIEYINKNCNDYFFAPNPTEPTATISGLISTDAKGTNHIKYGSVADNLLSIKMLLPNGKVHTFHKDDFIIKEDEYTLPNNETIVNLNKQNLYSGILGLGKNKDILHIFAGTEGILGVILEAELQLTKKIENKYGVLFLFRENTAFDFVNEAKKLLVYKEDSLVSFEYFDNNSLNILRKFKCKSAKLKDIPDINCEYKNAVYIELENDNMDNLEELLFGLLEQFALSGGIEEDTWAGVGENEIEKFSLFRHSLPEAINMIVEENKHQFSKITKIALDFKLDRNFRELFNMYNTLLLGKVDYAVFGHIYDNHLHVNILPKDDSELEFAYEMIDKFADFVSKNGGILAFENGIGKLKKALIKKYIDNDFLDNAKKIKEYLDKNYLFNRGNIL